MISVYDWWMNVGARYNMKYPDHPATFYYDNIVNIGLILNAKDRDAISRQAKYPAVFMLNSVREEVLIDESVRIRPRILIVTDSKRDYLFNERQLNTYKPTLYPILQNLLVLLQRYGLKNYTKYDRDYISGALREASVDAGVQSLFNDSLDAIELQGEITLRNEC